MLAHQRGSGTLGIGLEQAPSPGRDGGTTRLRHLHQATPLRALFPTPEPDEALTIAMVNTGGGLAGGDSLDITIAAGAGTRATISTAAAEKVYRSLGPPARIAARLDLGAGATLEWIPQETILFDRARLHRRITATLAPGATLLAAEMLVFGRAAREERFTEGALQDGWRLYREGRLLWADGLALTTPAALAAPFGFNGAEAMSTLLFAGDGAAALLPLLRAQGVAVTLPRPGLLLARALGPATALRRELGVQITALRAAALGLPARLPRLWTN